MGYERAELEQEGEPPVSKKGRRAGARTEGRCAHPRIVRTSLSEAFAKTLICDLVFWYTLQRGSQAKHPERAIQVSWQA
jgi:hypothetical protein